MVIFPYADLHLVPNSRSHKGSIHIGQQRSMNSRESGTQQADANAQLCCYRLGPKCHMLHHPPIFLPICKVENVKIKDAATLCQETDRSAYESILSLATAIVACPLQLLKTVKRCRKEILESILHNYSLPLLGCLHSRTEPSTSHQHVNMPRKGTNYQYVPMINTLPHPNKALVFPCPLRQSVRQWQLRPLSYNVHQLLCRVWVCHVALAVSWELLTKAWLDYDSSTWTAGC